MKWRNKGHELDSIGKNFSTVEEIYIYGAGENGTLLYEDLKIANIKITFVDSNIQKQSLGYLGCKVISPEEFFEKIPDSKKYFTVIALGINQVSVVMKKIVLHGFKEGIDAFSYKNFTEFYLPVFLMYHSQKMYVKYLDVSLTQHCNLKCKECSIMTPYIKQPKHKEFVVVCQDIDLLFEKVDYVHSLFLIGGEPLLYPHLEEICEYIGSKYKRAIGHLVIASNGLVTLKESLIKTIKHYNIEFQISDYSKWIKQTEGKMNDFIDTLTKFKIPYNRMVDLEWVDYGFRNDTGRKEKVENMENFFDSCGIDCRGLENGKFYYCFPAKMCQKVLEYKEYEDEYFDLRGDGRKMELLEFSLGYNEKGYLRICSRCNGSYLNNKNFIPVAEQL